MKQSMSTKWYEQTKGSVSTMRIIALMCAVVGNVIALSGAVALFLGKPEGVPLASVGAGLAGASGLAKAYQARGEK